MLKDPKKVIEELEKHRARMLFAKRTIESWEELDESVFQDPQKVAVIDSFIFRFAKFQDAMGKKLFPLTLQLLGENIENLPFIDWLNRLEKLGLIPSAQRWMELRALRNLLTHIYPWEGEKILYNLREALKMSEELLQIYETFKNLLERRGFLKNPIREV